MRSQRGLSLIELVIVMAVTAVLLASVVPAVGTLLVEHRLRALAEEHVQALHRTRSLAITRNTTVRYEPQGTGFTITAVGEPGEADRVLETRAPMGSQQSLSLESSSANIVFNGAGRSIGGGRTTLDFTAPAHGCEHNQGAVRCLRAAVTPAGQIRMCDPALTRDRSPQGC